MTEKFAVSYEIDYTHRVVVGVAAPDAETAKQLASKAFDEGSIWDDTENMPLLFDDYEEVNGETLRFSAEQVQEFPKPDASVDELNRRACAFEACKALLAGDVESARALAKKALPYAADSESDTKEMDRDNNISATSSPYQCHDCGRIYDDAKACESDDCPSKDKFITSSRVLAIAKSHDLELSTSVQGGARVKHFIGLKYDDRYVHKEGNNETGEISQEGFLNVYPDSLGKVWRIDNKFPTNMSGLLLLMSYALMVRILLFNHNGCS